jgi:F-type H+-transporting ATPase subunit delta
MSGIRIASRYAKSLLDLCIERGQLDAAKADMALLHSVMEESRDFRMMLSSPVVKADKKIDILNQVFDGKLSDITMGFINLLTRKGREGYLPEIVTSFLNQLRTHQGITVAEVTSAVALDASSRVKLMDAAKKLAGGEVELVEKVDASLIGGFILKVGDRQIDSAIANRIKALKRDFSENPYIAEI